MKISFIEYYLPERIVTNDDLQKENPDWQMDRVVEKSGVYQRFIAEESQTALDLAMRACDKLFENNNINKTDIDGIIFCTQTPDYIMPSNAFLIHKYLNLKTNVFAFDYNLACSGYIYGLVIANGFITSKIAKHILLINADTYSKFINKRDRSSRVLFSDAAAATVISAPDSGKHILEIELASSGREYENFYVPAGGCRLPKNPLTSIVQQGEDGNFRSQNEIHMNGINIWKFISKNIPKQIRNILSKNGMTVDDIDQFFFHQASKMTIDSIISSLKISRNQVFMNIGQTGNTVSASIPIAMKDAINSGKLNRGDRILLSGFGVGLSWGSILMKF